MDIISKLVKCAKENPQRIVLPEGTEERTMRAADRAIADGMAHIILIGNPTEILELAEKYGLGNISKAKIVDPLNNPMAEEYAVQLAEIRKKKGLTLERARELVKDPLYLGCMIIKTGGADGQLAGARNTTGNVLRPALQIIKTAPGITCVSGAMLLVTKEEQYGDGGLPCHGRCCGSSRARCFTTCADSGLHSPHSPTCCRHSASQGCHAEFLYKRFWLSMRSWTRLLKPPSLPVSSIRILRLTVNFRPMPLSYLRWANTKLPTPRLPVMPTFS